MENTNFTLINSSFILIIDECLLSVRLGVMEWRSRDLTQNGCVCCLVTVDMSMRYGRYEHALRSIRACVTVDMSISVGLYETICSALLQSLKAEWGCRVDGCDKARLRPLGGVGDMIVVGRHRGGAVKISERL